MPTTVRACGADCRSLPAGKLPRHVAGLVFDMGDVLYDATLWRRWLLKVLSRLGVHTNYRSFFHIWDHDFLADVHCGRRGFCEAFESFLLAVGLSRAQIDEVKASCQARRADWERNARLLPGVKPTLERLAAAGLSLGVLSDAEETGQVLSGRLERMGLPGVFTAVVSSRDIGVCKPNAANYLHVLSAMGVEPSRAVFVGHDADELAGAARVGMSTVAFNFDGEVRADVYLARFDQLVDAVLSCEPYAAAG
jgi:HAD superfamily hydrolase (TIGR01509 family)